MIGQTMNFRDTLEVNPEKNNDKAENINITNVGLQRE